MYHQYKSNTTLEILVKKKKKDTGLDVNKIPCESQLPPTVCPQVSYLTSLGHRYFIMWTTID